MACALELNEGYESIDQEDHEFKPGVITDTVFCKKDSQHFYSLFLPSTYTTDKKLANHLFF